MIKLYKRNWVGRYEYHEAWIAGDAVVEHWGRLGTRGQSKRHPVDKAVDESENLEAILADARGHGFKEIEHDDHRVLLVEYVIDGMGAGQDVEKRHALEKRLNELLGWTGLGDCDGGSIGSGTMEACCFVVDFALARDVIEKDLHGTPFDDYNRIFEEDAG